MEYSEFEIIKRYFDRIAISRQDVKKGIGDDCALLKVNEETTLVISTDTLVEGVHFFYDINPADLGYKVLAVNLSDLAAMGADPAWLTLALTLPKINTIWLNDFSNSLFELLESYNMQLIGGDTTCGPLNITLSVHGLVPNGKTIKRSGARPGDRIFVTGTLGDSAAGLQLLKNHVKINDPIMRQILIRRHLHPIPRIVQGKALRDIASSAIDLSDGLISDLGHILKASTCGARLNLDQLPLSSILEKNFEYQKVLEWALYGGEDYELCFTVPKKINSKALEIALNSLEVPFTCIGEIVPYSEGLTLFLNNQLINFNIKGFNHFEHC